MHTFFFISPLFRQCHCHKPIATIVFFILFRQCHCHKFIPTIFFPSISAKALPQTNWNKFFSLLFRYGHNSIPLFFVIKERDKPNYFGQKNTERIRICVLFFISLLYFDNAIATNNKFFFPFYSNSFPHFFFPSILAMALPQTMYFFFCFCLHHFIIRILYLSLQRVN